MFDPTQDIQKTMPPITKPIIAQKTLNLLARVRSSEGFKRYFNVRFPSGS